MLLKEREAVAWHGEQSLSKVTELKCSSIKKITHNNDSSVFQALVCPI